MRSTNTIVSLALLATAGIFLTGEAKGVDLCRKADYKALCRKVVKGESDPARATEAVIKKLISQTEKAKSTFAKQGKEDDGIAECLESYDDLVEELKIGLHRLKFPDKLPDSSYDSSKFTPQQMREHNKDFLKLHLKVASNAYKECDNNFKGVARKPPLVRTNTYLFHLARNCARLADQIS